jgi:hypothetical protein
MFKDNAALLQFKAQFLAHGDSKTESASKPQPAHKQSKPAQQKPRPVSKKTNAQPAPKVEEPRAIIKNHGFMLTDTYVQARNEILHLAGKFWGRAGTAEKVQAILVDVMVKLGVDASNKLIAETKLNKVGWRFQNGSAAEVEAEAEEAA